MPALGGGGSPSVTHSSDERPPIVVAAAWASRIITVSVEMVIPGLVGLWIDGQLGTEILFAVVGFAAGMVGGIWHLLRMLKRGDDSAEGK